jgi:Ca-activated chloride channel family protein
MEGEPSRLSNLKPLSVDVNLVLVPVTVTDSANRLVTGLERDQFVLYEGDQHQHIRYFSSEETPISLGVILDLSKSMQDKIDDARRAVAEFFEAAHPQDDYFVITFSDRPEVLADVTQSIGTIRAKLASAIPSGHTALLDAIYLGVSKMRSTRYQRRALLIISDGGDNRSRYRARELKRIVQEADVGIYAIGIFGKVFTTPEEWAGKRLLTEITAVTGGRTITLNDARELPAIAAALSRELRSQYVLGYRPSNPARDGQWRQIQVRLAPFSSSEPLHVYSKKGYFAPGH